MKKRALGILSLMFVSNVTHVDAKKVVDKQLELHATRKKNIEREKKRLDRNLKQREEDRKKEAVKREKDLQKKEREQQRNAAQAKKRAERDAARHHERMKRKEQGQKRELQEKVRDQQKREKLAQKRERARKQAVADKARCLELDREVNAHYAAYKAQLKERHAFRKDQLRLQGEWKNHRNKVVHDEYAMGAYADLYKSPAWPTYATYIRHKWLFNTGFNYRYATDAYSCDGHNHDITRLVFGENDVRVRDVLLVSKLLGQQQDQGDFQIGSTPLVYNQKDQDIGGQNVIWPANQYLRYLANEKIKFLGEQKEMRWNFDIARYIWKRNVAVGIELPIVYMKNRLRASMRTVGDEANGFAPAALADTNALNAGENLNAPSAIRGRTGLVNVAPGTPAIDSADATSPNNFLRRYGNSTDAFIHDIFNEKCMPKFGGSSGGLGDVTVFAHAYVDSARFDKMMFGARVIIPTAQRANVNQLWAPELGNGGYCEFAGFMNLVLSHNWWLNPHLFLQVSGTFLKAHVKKRVPKRVTFPSQSTEFDDFIGFQGVTFSDRITIAADTTFTELDTTFRNLGDFTARFASRKGPEFTIRVGNIVEKFIWRRAFLDVWYQFKAKVSDHVSGLDCKQWCLEVYKKNTETIEHRTGFDFSYQFDAGSRIHTGLAWTFAGRNVPVNLDWNISVNYSF